MTDVAGDIADEGQTTMTYATVTIDTVETEQDRRILLVLGLRGDCVGDLPVVFGED